MGMYGFKKIQVKPQAKRSETVFYEVEFTRIDWVDGVEDSRANGAALDMIKRYFEALTEPALEVYRRFEARKAAEKGEGQDEAKELQLAHAEVVKRVEEHGGDLLVEVIKAQKEAIELLDPAELGQHLAHMTDLLLRHITDVDGVQFEGKKGRVLTWAQMSKRERRWLIRQDPINWILQLYRALSDTEKEEHDKKKPETPPSPEITQA